VTVHVGEPRWDTNDRLSYWIDVDPLSVDEILPDVIEPSHTRLAVFLVAAALVAVLLLRRLRMIGHNVCQCACQPCSRGYHCRGEFCKSGYHRG